MKRLVTLSLAALMLFLAANAAFAVTQLSPELEQEARHIESLLQCPVCKGQALAESTSQVAVEMKAKIRQMLAEGKTRQEVLDYYVARYGDWILSQPPARGMGLVAWILPPALALAGLAILGSFMKRSRARRGMENGEAVRPAGAARVAGEEQLYSRLKDYI